MNIPTFFKLYIIAVPTFVVLDFLWIGMLAKNFYQQQIGHLLRPSFDFKIAALFYLLYGIGLVIFVLEPSVKQNSFSRALIYGALYGLFTYATYDLTNHATLKGWSWLMTLVDISWGVFVTAIVSALAYTLGKKIMGL